MRNVKDDQFNTYNLLHYTFLGALFFLPVLVILPSIESNHLSYDEIYLQPKVMWLYAVILPFSLIVIFLSRKNFQLRIKNILIFAFALYLILSSISHDTYINLWGSADRADGLVMHLLYTLLMLSGIVLSKGTNRLTTFFLLLAAALSISNIGQQLHLYSIIGDSSKYSSYSGVSASDFGGLLGNRGYLGGFLAIMMPIIAYIGTIRSKNLAFWSSICLILTVWAWLGTFTRGVWLAGLAGMITLLLSYQPSLKLWKPITLGIASFVLTSIVTGNTRVFYANSNDGQTILDSSGRTVLWNSALYGIQKKSLFGWGAFSLYRAMNNRPEEILIKESNIKDIRSFINVRKPLNPWADVDINTLPPHFKIIHNSGKVEDLQLVIDKVHNEYLDYALTYGIPAALLFTVLLFSAIWSGRKVVPGISAGLVAYAVYLFTWPEIIRFAPIAWFLMGVALAAGSTRQPPADLAKNDLQPAPKS